MSADQKTIIITGAGFGGVYAAVYLRRYVPNNWQIVLFSQENHFVFTPLLGDVVGASINPMHVVWPVRQMARHVTCLTAQVTDIDLTTNEVIYEMPGGRSARRRFDHLVLACGSIVNLDIIPGMAAHGFPLKTMGDALVLRNHLITQLEKAEVEPDPHVRRHLLSVVVVGGGFSGVEVAGEAWDLLRTSARFYQVLQQSEIHVTLLEARDRILPELPASLSEFARSKMQRHGIEIRTGAIAAAVTGEGIRLADGSHIDAATIICTIGTSVSPIVRQLQLPMERNRIKTEGDMRVVGKQTIWALGDCAAVPNAATGMISPPTAQLAVRQAKRLAKNLAAAIRGKPTTGFSYKPQGMLAAIGNYKGVGTILGVRVSGFVGWFLWRGVYLAKMPTLARKLQVAFDWAWQLIFPRDIVQLNLAQTERLSRRHYEAGQYVFRKGDPGDFFYIIQKGSAGVYLEDDDTPITKLHEGEYFGESALLTAAPRSASIRAEEPLDVLAVSRDTFLQMAAHLDVFRKPVQRSSRAARASRQLLNIAHDHPLLQSTQVGEIMGHPVHTLSAELTFAEALEQSQKIGKGAYPVINEHGDMVGICTRSDFYRALEQLRPAATPITSIMTSPVLAVLETDSLASALYQFLRHPVKRLVVVRAEEPTKPVGVITPFDIVQAIPIGELEAAYTSSSSSSAGT